MSKVKMTASNKSPNRSGPIPLCVPEIRGNEWKYVKECLDTGWVSSVGSFVDRFERMVADYVGAKYAVATVNGTAALHISLMLAGVAPDDEVLVSTLTFIAPANAIRYSGAWPVFIDAEPDYWQMDSARVRDFLENGCRWKDGALRNKSTGRRVRAIVPVHILGHPVDMDPILELARKYDLAVIEDATESLGARYDNRKVGRLGDIACFSFNGNKLITTGGGGMIVTDNDDWARRAKYLTTQAKDDPIEYVHNEVGYNYRLTNVQAAMGCAQMENLDEYIFAKRKLAADYAHFLKDVAGVRTMKQAPWAYSTFWMYTVKVDQTIYGMGSRELLRALDEAGIQTRPLWQPIHASMAHQAGAFGAYPVADRLYGDCLSLPCSVGLSRSQLRRVTSAVTQQCSEKLVSNNLVTV
jgi:perosamine synthetase